MSFIDKIYQQLAAAEQKPLIIEVRGKELVPTAGSALKDLVARARGYLATHGVKAGDRVALIAHNGARWAAADVAILGTGAICVPMYDRQASSELAGMLANCEASLVLVDTAKLKGELESAWPTHCKVALFDEVFAHAPSADITPVARPAGDRVTMIYTSGTSGEPKGVLYTHENVDFMLARTGDRLREMVGTRAGGDKVFHYLPFCFAGSRIQLWTQLTRGNPLMVSTDLNNLVQELGAADPHYFLNVPALLERIRTGVGNKLKERGGAVYKLYETAVQAGDKMAAGQKLGFLEGIALGAAKRIVFPKIRQQVGKSLEFLICGSAPLSEQTQRWFELVGIPVYQVYGLTETTAICTMDRKGLARAGYVGRAIDGVEMKLSDEGELLIRGANIFPEYWKRPEATAKSIQNGWFHTGDMAELTSDGDLRIVGRVKDLLVPESGHNVAPGPLEEKLLAYCNGATVGSSRVDLQACKLEYSIVSPK